MFLRCTVTQLHGSPGNVIRGWPSGYQENSVLSIYATLRVPGLSREPYPGVVPAVAKAPGVPVGSVL